MNRGSVAGPASPPWWITHPASRAIQVAALLYVFLVGVNGLGSGFKSLSSDFVNTFFAVTANPFMGLMVGILATTLVQSSSVTTSLIVSLVAAQDFPLPVANAVPMIMGANIGTTVTNTIASLAHIGRREEFRRAFSVATCHDFFNYMAVLIFLPLELLTGYLQRTATILAGVLGGFGGADYESPIKGAIKAGGVPVRSAVTAVLGEGQIAAVGYILVSGVLIFIALLAIVGVMRTTMGRRVEVFVSRAFARNAMLAIIVGAVATVMVQSSSITTSLLVPLAGAGVITLRQAFPITLGANVGTTVTALLAALAATDENAEAGLTIALVHLLFNISATALVYPFAVLRNIPLMAAQRLADVAVRSRRWALIYVLVLFYGIPALFAFFNRILA